MSDKGIIFSAPMLEALNYQGKTQTRRLCAWANNPMSPALTYIVACDEPGWFGDEEGEVQFKAGYAPGDRLWVREAWHFALEYDHLSGSQLPRMQSLIEYDLTVRRHGSREAGRYRHARFMPRWASRVTLIVSDVRVQRLQAISEADALAEGILHWEADETDPAEFSPVEGGLIFSSAVEAYRALWNTLHTKPGERWDDNPWIVALSFGVRAGNIDKVFQ